jgi:hypothetical protein
MRWVCAGPVAIHLSPAGDEDVQPWTARPKIAPEDRRLAATGLGAEYPLLIDRKGQGF